MREVWIERAAKGAMRPLAVSLAFGLLSCLPVQAKVDVQQFADYPAITQVKISPEGDYLAAVRTVEIDGDPARDVLVVFEYPQLKLTATLALVEGLDVADYFWANTNRLVARAGRRVNRLDGLVLTNQLFGINADGSQLEQLTINRSAIPINLMLQDPKHILVAGYYLSGNRLDVQVGKLDVYEGSYERIARSKAKDAAMIADVHGNLRLSVSQDDDLNVRLHRFDPASRRWSLLSTAKFSESIPKPIRVSPDGRYVDLVTAIDRGPEGLFRLDLETNKRTLIYRHEVADVEPLLDHKQTIWGAENFDGRGGVALIDKEHPLAQSYAELEPLFPGKKVRFSNSAWDYSRIVVRVGDADSTPEWFLLDNTGKQSQLLKLYDSYPQIDDSALGRVEPISLLARDGVRIRGYLTKPRIGSAPYPLVVMPHGGPLGVQDVWRYNPDVQVLAANGYAVLQVNYRGSAGYGAYFGSLGIGEYGGAIHRDITDAARWSIAQGHTKAGELCIYGWSYGGYAALYGAALEPDLYACAVGAAGPYDMQLQHRRADYSYRRAGAAFSKKVVAEDAAARRLISPITYVDAVKAKVLLVHGAKDERVPVAHARKMRKALSKAGNTPEYLEKPYEGHGFRDPENVAEFYQRLLRFLDDSIGRKADP